MARDSAVAQNTMVGKPSITARSTAKSMGACVSFAATPGGDMPRQSSYSGGGKASGASAPQKGKAWSQDMNGPEFTQKSGGGK